MKRRITSWRLKAMMERQMGLFSTAELARLFEPVALPKAMRLLALLQVMVSKLLPALMPAAPKEPQVLPFAVPVVPKETLSSRLPFSPLFSSTLRPPDSSRRLEWAQFCFAKLPSFSQPLP
jgi:hypothetical protein